MIFAENKKQEMHLLTPSQNYYIPFLKTVQP